MMPAEDLQRISEGMRALADAGVTTAGRHAEMAAEASMALLVATAETEHADDTKSAR